MLDIAYILYAIVGGLVGLLCLSWCCKHNLEQRRMIREIIGLNQVNIPEYPLPIVEINNISNGRTYVRYLELNPEIVGRLAHKPYEIIENFDSEKECTICLDPIGEIECKLNCGHSYHFECIKEWAYYRNNNNCPQCRGSIVDVEV